MPRRRFSNSLPADLDLRVPGIVALVSPVDWGVVETVSPVFIVIVGLRSVF